MSDARRFSAVTRIDPNFNPERGSQLVWFSDLIVQDSSAGLQATAQQVSVIQGTIESQLMRKYYRFTENRDDADYMVAAALVMDDSVQSQEITDLVQIFPGLANAFNDLESGTLLVVITAPTDPRTAPLLWRGAIQAYTVGEALPDQMRLDRLRSFTARLIDAVPEARN
ncbi:MAG: hypothetical protein GKR91_17465 [Pseudomonadales bacterium]|nr:hypothetical protein [Pseudomonadales bacterium]